MRHGFRYSTLFLVLALLLCFGMSAAAQQINFFPDFSTPGPNFLQLNGSPPNSGIPNLAQWQDSTVLRLTGGGANSPEASTVYFQQQPNPVSVGEQPVIVGFTTWFQFQAHNLQCCTPGDGFAFIVQFAPSTDSTYGARGTYVGALGAGNGDVGGGLGYAGINNSLAIEFDLAQNPWDPNGNHIAVQTCGPNTNTPVHDNGSYTIGNHQNVPNCLYSYMDKGAIYTPQIMMGGTCNGESCTDGIKHDVVIGYTAPSQMQPQSLLQVWLDPQYVNGTHTPKGAPNLSVPYNIVYDSQINPFGLQLDYRNGAMGNAWVGFASSQPDDGMQMDILAWQYTPGGPSQVQQLIQPGGTQTVFNFGEHQTTVTYPKGFMNDNNILMTVVATPTDRQMFYQNRLAGTMFANEQCIVYSGTGGGGGSAPPTSTNGNCLVYSYSCQDQQGNQVTCPTEPDCTNPQGNQCIVINTSYDTADNVTATNADYLENDAVGDNNWMSIFTSFMNAPIDGTTSGGSRGFGGSGSSGPSPRKRRFLTGNASNADIVATFRPNQP
jgi:Legume lectin domain